MKISRSGPNNSFQLQPATPAGPSGVISASKRTPGSEPTDQAQLSTLSSYLAAALSGSPAHVAKLAELSTAVSNGQYHVDAYSVSGSVIQHSIEFGGSSYWRLST